MKLNVAHINFSDNRGGAAILAQSVISCQNNIESSYLCARPTRKDSKLLGFGIGGRAGIGLKLLHKFSCLRNSWLGDTTGILSKVYLKQISEKKPDIIHLHNIHGGWFDLSLLESILSIAPVVWTIHDEWPYTGHCVYTLGCEKWRKGCGKCPSLQIMIALKRDATAKNWQKRNDIYRQVADKNITMVAVSYWLGKRIKQSGIWPGRVETIPNGIDTKVFYPIDRGTAKKNLGIAKDAKVLLYIAEGGINNPFKNGILFYNMLKHLPCNLNFKAVVLGCDFAECLHNSAIPIINSGYISDIKILRAYYSAADLLVYPTKADTFGLVVAEAMACGTPVLATNVGGVTEQIIEGQNGFVVELGIDEKALAKKVVNFFSVDQDKMCDQGDIANFVKRKYSNIKMANAYYNLYSDMIEQRINVDE